MAVAATKERMKNQDPDDGDGGDDSCPCNDCACQGSGRSMEDGLLVLGVAGSGPLLLLL